ncbi:MAG: hypothetical protein JSR36_11400 [Proteobacteria bacterium]|nr:hypothetical protein [Pseudomonadota bacterium]
MLKPAAYLRLALLTAASLAAMDPGAVSAQTPSSPADGAAATSKLTELEKEVADMKAENAAAHDQLRKMEEQQKTLMEKLDSLQRQLQTQAAANAPSPGTPAAAAAAAAGTQAGSAGAAANAPLTAVNTGNASAQAAAPGPKGLDERYQDGIVVWQTPNDASVPFLLKFNLNTQLRYLNTTSANDTYTDHLGVVRDVNKRNDITVNRTMFILGGYIFDPRLRYSSTVWTSAGAASIVVAGNIGWVFNKAFTLTGGYTGVPGSRSLVNTFPFFQAIDRTMADNFFRPGFTQGMWANGELSKGLYYLAFVGNGLNTLNISANKIDTDLLYSGSLWWEPLGDYGPPGKSRNMYDDYFASDNVRVRLGGAFTQSREDRFSNLDQSAPENTSMYNSDGVLTFSTGAFAPGVTVDKATYRMLALDWGVKWNGWAVNGQYYFRWLDNFLADGPIPVSSTFDHGFELVAGGFVIPKTLMVYGRGSAVFGQFGNSWEAGAGAKWYFLPTERMWLTGELLRTVKVPYSGTFTPYTAGMTAWVPMIQAVLAF